MQLRNSETMHWPESEILNAFKLDVYKVDNIANFVYYGKTRLMLS